MGRPKTGVPDMVGADPGSPRSNRPDGPILDPGVKRKDLDDKKCS